MIRLPVQNTTGAVAETLQRRWLAFENIEEYLRGSKFRFVPSWNSFGTPSNNLFEPILDDGEKRFKALGNSGVIIAVGFAAIRRKNNPAVRVL